MRKRYLILALGVFILIASGIVFYYGARTNCIIDEKGGCSKENSGQSELQSETVSPEQNTEIFTGPLERVDTGCFADGECFVVVDRKHVTTLRGWSQETVGSVVGVEGFGDLENYLGKQVEVYAQKMMNGTYTLYGSEGFYIKLADSDVQEKSGTMSERRDVPVDESNSNIPHEIILVDEPKPQIVKGECMVGGCSGQLCVDTKNGDDMMTTCEYQAEYACYQGATCERQAGGQCGWTMSSTLAYCLDNVASNPHIMNLEVQ